MRLYTLASAEPWAILPEAVPALLAAAERADDDPSAVNPAADPSWRAEHEPTTRDGVREIPVRGVILRHADLMQARCGGASVQSLAGHLKDAVGDPAIKAVVLHFDTPGGQVSGVGELATLIREATAVKPVVAYVGGAAASAGYWLASACSEVVCAPTAMLGSIGVVRQVDTRKPKNAMTIVSTQSPMKWADPLTDSGKAEMQRTVDDLGAVFVGDVAGYRGRTPAQVLKSFGQGGVKVGAAAVKAGMADATGTFESVLSRLARGEKAAGQTTPSGDGKTTSKGTVMPFNPFSVIAKMFEADPQAVQSAMSADAATPDASAAAFLAALTKPAPAPAEKPAPPVDAEAVQAAADRRATEKARASLAKFYGAQAKAFTLAAVKGGRIAPAESPAMNALFVELALLDSDGMLAVEGGQPVDRIALLTSAVNRRDSISFTGEVVTTPDAIEGGTTLPTASEGGNGVSADKILAMLAATEHGRASLAARAKAGK